MCATMPAFMQCCGMNQGLGACWVSVLPTEPHAQPQPEALANGEDAAPHSKPDHSPSFQQAMLNGFLPDTLLLWVKCLSESESNLFMSHSASHLLTTAYRLKPSPAAPLRFSLVNLPFIWEVPSGDLEGGRAIEHFDSVKLVILKEEAGQRANSIVLNCQEGLEGSCSADSLSPPFLAVGCHPGAAPAASGRRSGQRLGLECSLKARRTQDSWTRDRPHGND